MEIEFSAILWEWSGQGAWCFVTVPTEYYNDICLMSSTPRRGFGSVQVVVTVGSATWKTSLFPDTKSGSYLLPVKKDIRIREKIEVGDSVNVNLRLFGV